MLAINIEDVISVLNTCKPYLIGLAVVLVLAIVAMVACRKMARSKKFLIRGEAALAMVLAIAVTVNLICFGPMSSLISLAMGDGSVTDETAASANELCQTIAEEGIVMVKNEGALPLSNTKLNVFGWSSTNPVYGGTGSGGLSDSYPTVSLLEGLSNAGIEYNTTITDFYTEYRDTRPTVGMWGQDWTIPEPTMEEYDAAGIFENAKEYSDTALIVISRSGGEGADLPTSYDGEDTFEEGGTWGASGVRISSQDDDRDASKHYLELSNREIAMVERVTSEFDNVIVVINAANPMELGWLDQYDSIKGALVMAGPGQTGFNALGEILTGEVNPSAKMVDTYVYDLTQTPTWNNFGSMFYDNMDEFAVDGAVPFFVNYVEGIYVGYKFYETAAAEGIIDCDGPASINNNFTGKGSIGFPAAVMIAATWNVDLANDFGERIGKMADEMGVSGWYAPAMNTHRSAFAGRNFEYYSEDGVLGGNMAANAILGAQEHGVYAYMKHFALNDQETNRCGMLCTWANEQSIREIYLKPFEIAVKDGGCQAVMSSFNYIGTTWAGACDELLNNVLRDEWGFQGFVLTDYFGVYGYMDSDQAIRGGTDCMLVAYDTETNHVTDTTSATSVLAMRQACKNILYTTVNSRAYDPANLSGGGLQGWQIAAIAIDVVVGVILVAGAVMIIKKSKKMEDASTQA